MNTSIKTTQLLQITENTHTWQPDATQLSRQFHELFKILKFLNWKITTHSRAKPRRQCNNFGKSVYTWCWPSGAETCCSEVHERRKQVSHLRRRLHGRTKGKMMHYNFQKVVRVRLNYLCILLFKISYFFSSIGNVRWLCCYS
jgi:hypothetical protein